MTPLPCLFRDLCDKTWPDYVNRGVAIGMEPVSYSLPQFVVIDSRGFPIVVQGRDIKFEIPGLGGQS